ncbi:hypothetical protein [Nocardioides sp. YR527]|uniref:hypothetical protein n=1 Tax=Nocardioides sp. YR527 TaxID=1881028 RepID=UPI0015A39A66|nr:hypothetical protein [Nocardioides sp. YR527]
MKTLIKVVAWVVGLSVGLAFLAASLIVLESTGGHDGWLCEWGIDTDGAGTGTSGCG